MQQVLQYRVDAILLTSSPISFDWIDNCAQFDIPVLLFNRYSNNHNVTAVCCDNVEAGRHCADYLIKKGYTQFAYIGSIEDVSTSIDRQKGFLDRLQEQASQSATLINAPFPMRRVSRLCEIYFLTKQKNTMLSFAPMIS